MNIMQASDIDSTFLQIQTVCLLTATLIVVKGEYYDDAYVEALSLYRKIRTSVLKEKLGQ